MTNLEDDEVKAYTTFYNDGKKIAMVVGTKDGIDFIKADQISLSINESTGDTVALIRADHIVMEGETSIEDLLTGVAQIEILDVKDLYADQLVVDGSSNVGSLEADTTITAGTGFKVGNDQHVATWQTETIPTFTFSGTHSFVYRQNGVDYTTSGKIIGTSGTKSIHYLGYSD
jgi:hypothetical protein